MADSQDNDPYAPPTGATRATPAPSTPTSPTAAVRRSRTNAANEATTILTPVPAASDATHRIPLAERNRWRLLAAVGGGLAVVAIVAATWLGFVAADQSTRIDDLTIERESLVEQLRAEQDQVLEQQQRVDELAGELEVERQRVLELADLNSQTGQQFQDAQEVIEALDEVNAVAASTANVMQTCVDNLETLVGYLENADDYSQSQINAFTSQTSAQCTAAQRANELLQDLVAES